MSTIARKWLLLNDTGTYANTLIDKYGATVVWPLVDMRSGTSILSTPAGYEGVATGFDLQNTPGPVSGEGNAPYLDGVIDSGDIYSAALASIFDASVGAMSIWCRVTSAEWTDARVETAIGFSDVTASNYITLRIHSSNNVFRTLYVGDGAAVLASSSGSNYTNWFQAFVRWDNPNNLLQFGLNGVQVGGDQDPTAWAGSLNANGALIGALNVGGGATFLWKGWLAYMTLWAGTAPSLTDFATMYTEVTG